MRYALPLLLPILLLTGCQTTLAPDGVYDGDVAIYNAENTIVQSYALMDTFLQWEYDNRESLSSMPEIKQAADHIRENGERWISSAQALVDVYKANPTKENQISLNSSISVIRVALEEAAKYMTIQPE